jgi:DNA-binding NtrC family response regulator
MPSLRERVQDIPILCEHFIGKANKELKTTISAISQPALEKLQKHPWRGNIRELRNTIYSACLNASNETLDIEDMPMLGIETSDATEEALQKLCKQYLDVEGPKGAKKLEALMHKTFLHVSFELCPNISQLCDILSISRNTLKKQLREYGIARDIESD